MAVLAGWITQWIRAAGLTLVEGGSLFEDQAAIQSRCFVQGYGE